MSEINHPHFSEHLLPPADGETMMPDDDQAFYDNGSEKPHDITPWIEHVRRQAEADGVYDDASPQTALGGGDYDSWWEARRAPAEAARQTDRKYYQEQFGLSGRPESGQAEMPSEVRRAAAVIAFESLLNNKGCTIPEALAILRARQDKKRR